MLYGDRLFFTTLHSPVSMISIVIFAICLRFSSAQVIWACDPDIQPQVISIAGSSVASQNYGSGNYRANDSCTWRLENSDGSNLQLSFESFVLEDSENCANDYLEVYDGANETAPLLARWCGEMFTEISNVPLGATAFLKMVTNNNTEATGFKATMTYADFSDACDGGIVYRNQTSGNITSPNYPQNYPSGADCTWNIVYPDATKAIQIGFSDFQLEDSCGVYDYVYIYDGMSAEGREMFAGLGPVTFNNFTFTNYGDVGVSVRFTTDSSVTFRGFALTWDVVDKPKKP